MTVKYLENYSKTWSGGNAKKVRKNLIRTWYSYRKKGHQSAPVNAPLFCRDIPSVYPNWRVAMLINRGPKLLFAKRAGSARSLLAVKDTTTILRTTH